MNIIFPFDMIEKNSRVILYGYNKLSQNFYQQFAAKEYCVLSLWTDDRFDDEEKLCHPFGTVDKINTTEYDHIIIAESQHKPALKMRNRLLALGIPAKKIIWSDTYVLNTVDFPADHYKTVANPQYFLNMIKEYSMAEPLVDGFFYQSLPQLGIEGVRNSAERYYLYRFSEFLRKDMSVLDIGCNTGFIDLIISPHVNDIIGIDIDSHFINVAESAKRLLNIDNCKFFCANFCNWQSPKMFDLIISCAVHNWIGLSMDEYIKAIDSRLSNNGYFVFESNSLEKDDAHFKNYVDEFCKRNYEIRYRTMSTSRIGMREVVVFKKGSIYES